MPAICAAERPHLVRFFTVRRTSNDPMLPTGRGRIDCQTLAWLLNAKGEKAPRDVACIEHRHDLATDESAPQDEHQSAAERHVVSDDERCDRGVRNDDRDDAVAEEGEGA